jgi:hypothetical protein
MSETTAMTAAVPPKSDALVHTGGTSYVTTPAARAVTPMPTAAKTVAAMFQAGPHVTDPIPAGPLKGYSRALVDVVKDTVARGAGDEQLFLFITQAMQLNLDPLRKEVWCVNMAGQGQPPQWMIAPSRDGYLKMAQRHPNFDSINAQIVHESDKYFMDPVNGRVVHEINSMKASGPILGAWCIVTTRDGKKFTHQVLIGEVRRGTKVWDNFTAQMTLKAVQSQTLRMAGLSSDLYTTDKVWEAIESDDMRNALLVNPTQQEYFEGFIVGGDIAPHSPAQIAEPTGPSRQSRTDGVKALTDRIVEIARTVEGAEQADAIDARIAWLTAVVGHGALGKITEPQEVWDLVDLLESEEGADHFSQLLTAAREARWTKEAKAKEFAEAGQAPSAAAVTAEPAIDVEVVADDDIPPFEKPAAGGEVA